jgi:hypothetical protein
MANVALVCGLGSLSVKIGNAARRGVVNIPRSSFTNETSDEPALAPQVGQGPRQDAQPSRTQYMGGPAQQPLLRATEVRWRNGGADRAGRDCRKQRLNERLISGLQP